MQTMAADVLLLASKRILSGMSAISQGVPNFSAYPPPSTNFSVKSDFEF
jgi:hypothetical protein